MTLDELTSDVWAGLSARKYAAGKRRVRRIVARCVASWPASALASCTSQAHADVVARSFAARIYKAEEKVGMGFILTLLLSALVSEIVRLIMQWWIDRHVDRAELAALSASTREECLAS